ncbi:MAG: hypothetical protein ACREL6_00990 [Gemmatimonadales bacterium]
MPQTPPSPDPMAREVDRLLAQLASDRPQTVRNQTGRGVRNTIVSGANPVPSRRNIVALWARIVLCITLAGFMTQWPYPRACGFPLLGYAGAVAVVMLAGAWVSLVSWKLRSGPAHIASILLLSWGIVLATTQVLPRAGYAAEVASWRCTAVLFN